MEFIYSAVNAVASGKLDQETEERVSRAIEAELLEIAAHLPAKASGELFPEHGQASGITANLT